jgi:hypothetical protein
VLARTSERIAQARAKASATSMSSPVKEPATPTLSAPEVKHEASSTLSPPTPLSGARSPLHPSLPAKPGITSSKSSSTPEISAKTALTPARVPTPTPVGASTVAAVTVAAAPSPTPTAPPTDDQIARLEEVSFFHTIFFSLHSEFGMFISRTSNAGHGWPCGQLEITTYSTLAKWGLETSYSFNKRLSKE